MGPPTLGNYHMFSVEHVPFTVLEGGSIVSSGLQKKLADISGLGFRLSGRDV